MNQKLIFLLVISLIYSTNSKLTKTDWVNKLEALTRQPSHYRNKYPYNLLYWDGSSWWCDCSNLMKALFNGRNINDKRKGSYQKDLKDPGDVTVEGLFNQCTSISSDFKLLKKGEPRLLHKQGHVGAYIGVERKTKQGIVNSVECTSSMGGGIKYTYVDSRGGRYKCKGCGSLGQWTRHGKPTKWVTY